MPRGRGSSIIWTSPFGGMRTIKSYYAVRRGYRSLGAKRRFTRRLIGRRIRRRHFKSRRGRGFQRKHNTAMRRRGNRNTVRIVYRYRTEGVCDENGLVQYVTTVNLKDIKNAPGWAEWTKLYDSVKVVKKYEKYFVKNQGIFDDVGVNHNYMQHWSVYDPDCLGRPYLKSGAMVMMRAQPQSKWTMMEENKIFTSKLSPKFPNAYYGSEGVLKKYSRARNSWFDLAQINGIDQNLFCSNGIQHLWYRPTASEGQNKYTIMCEHTYVIMLRTIRTDTHYGPIPVDREQVVDTRGIQDGPDPPEEVTPPIAPTVYRPRNADRVDD